MTERLLNPDGFDMAEGLREGFADFFFGGILAEKLLGVFAGGFDFGHRAELDPARAADDDRVFRWLIGGFER